MKHENNFFTYLKWRGDISLKESPFNEIDALILCELAYIRFENVVPTIGQKGAITIKEADKKYVRKNEKDIFYYKRKEELLATLAKCSRFADMTLCNYVSTYDNTASPQQFAAMHINLSPKLTFIAFRGTDSTIAGWKEDFNMSFMMPVPAQQSAVDYVNKTMKGFMKKYWLGGHSKGGNLAIYSGVFCDAKLQKKIVKVSSFDGPGFTRKVVKDKAYKRLEDKINSYVPVSSVVGLIMEHAEKYKVVESKESPFLQHEGFSWEVCRDEFVQVEEIGVFSKRVTSTLKTWLNGMTTEERKALVDAVFQVFETAEVEDLSELVDIDIKMARKLIKGIANVPKEQRGAVGKLFRLFTTGGRERKTPHTMFSEE